MKSGAANNDWDQKIDQDQKSINFHRFTDADSIVTGDDFIVICNKGGWVEVYDKEYNLMSTEVFLNLKSVDADQYITVTLKNGWSEVYDKWFNMKSVKYCGD